MIKQISQDVAQAIKKLFDLEVEVVVEVARDIAHGDYATNAALLLAKSVAKPPREVASAIITHLGSDDYEATVAGPGFINFRLSQQQLKKYLNNIISEDILYGKSTYGQGKRVNVEFVSANPTGPLHLGHARQAAIGDSLCRILASAGYEVCREYYYNDCGNQVFILGQSLRIRYQQLFDSSIAMPEDSYHGEDIIDIARHLQKELGNDLANRDNAFFAEYAVKWQKRQIDETLRSFRVAFDVYTSEKVIRESGVIEKMLDGFKQKQHTYDAEGATWLRTSAYGDDKDRVLIKNDRSYTYIVPDIAYHINKLERKFDYLIDLLGADHHGYLARMRAALQMMDYNSDRLDFIIVQMVRMLKEGQEIKLSKRSGLAVTINDLVEEIGIDAARYIFVSRAASSHLDIDVDLLKKTSNENPVYYAQYAHARTCSLIALGKEMGLSHALEGEIDTTAERALIILLADFQNIIVDAAINMAPSRIALFIQKVAQQFHAFYSECKVLDTNNKKTSQIRLCIIEASRIILRNSLLLLGVNSPERM